MDSIKFSDFQKLDIRIGTVTKAEVPEWSHWVMKLTVDCGQEIGERVIFAGIMKFYDVKDIEGKQFPFVVNLEPKKIGPMGDFSQGMMMAAISHIEEPIKVEDEEVNEKPVLLSPIEKVENGSKIR